MKIDTTLSLFMASFSGVFAFLGISPVQFTILAVLMFLDFITGIAKAYRLDRNSVTSSEMRVGIISKLLYLLVPLVIALTLHGVNMPEFGYWIISFSINALVLAEGYSVLANIYTFKTKKVIEEIDAISYVLRLIKNRLDKYVG
jgi:phage-related holin